MHGIISRTNVVHNNRQQRSSKHRLRNALDKAFPDHYTIDYFHDAHEVYLSCRVHGPLKCEHTWKFTCKKRTADGVEYQVGRTVSSLLKSITAQQHPCVLCKQEIANETENCHRP